MARAEWATSSLSTASSLGLQRSGEHALRQAYAERLRCLGRKLAAAEGGGSADETTLRPVRCPSPSPESYTSNLQSQLEVEALVQKVHQLCQERRSLKNQATNVDERYARIIHDLKAELEAAQAQYAEMRADQVRLQQRLSGVAQEQDREQGSLARLREESERSLHAEIHQLEASCRLSASRLGAMQAESQDCQRRHEHLASEQHAIEAEASSVEATATASKVELEGVHERLRQSEAETKELEEKCSLVAGRFERVMEVAEKENQELAQELQAKARSLRRKAEKHRKSAEEAKAKLNTAQGLAQRQRTILGERDAAIQRLRETCEAERVASLKQQEQFFEIQRKSLLDQASEIQRRGGMMPIDTHQRMLQEQGEWFANAVKELEEALRRQQQNQERERERLLELQLQERAMHEQQREQEKQRMLGVREQQRLLEQQERAQFLEADAVQNEAALRCQRLEDELHEAQSALVQTEASAAAVEEQRAALANSLEAVSARLGQLRTSLETERSAKHRSQGALAEARRRLDSTHRAEASSAMQLGVQDELRSSWKRLEGTWNDQVRQISALDQAISELRKKNDGLQSEVAALHLEKQQMETKMRSSQELGRQLEKQRASIALATRRKREEATRLRCLLSGHADRSRRAASALKAKLREEQAALIGDLNGRMQQWKWAVSRDQAQLNSKCSTVRESSDAANRSKGELASRLDALRISDERRRLRIDSSLASLLAQRSSVDRGQAAMRVAVADTEQLVLCISKALPEGLTPSTVQGLLSDCSDGGTTALTEALVSLEAELRRNVEVVKAAAVNDERQKGEDKICQTQSESDAAQSAKLAQLTEQRALLETGLHALEFELRTIQERSGDGAERTQALNARRDHLAKLDEQLEKTKEESRAATEHAKSTHSKLEESKLNASVVEEDARKDAQRPLQRELQEVSSQLELLHLRFGSDLGHHEAAWKEHFQKCELKCEAMWKSTEATLQEEISGIHSQLSKASSVPHEGSLRQTCESSANAAQEELSVSCQAVQDTSSELSLLRSRLSTLIAATAAHRETIRTVERRTSEASDARRREALEAMELERASARMHKEAMARLRQQCDAGTTNLEAEARFSLSSISRRIATADGGAALQTHTELTAKAELLAERARAQFASA